jgi:hypothetical protein
LLHQEKLYRNISSCARRLSNRAGKSPKENAIMEPIKEPESPIEALKVLPNNVHQNWLKDRGLRKLNTGIAFMFASSAGTGYNGSLINGLLVLPECKLQVGKSRGSQSDQKNRAKDLSHIS